VLQEGQEGVVSNQVKKKLDRCKSPLSTKYPKGVDYDTLFDELTEMFLDRKDPERRAERRKTNSKKDRPIDVKKCGQSLSGK
jgi:hypothetical protein